MGTQSTLEERVVIDRNVRGGSVTSKSSKKRKAARKRKAKQWTYYIELLKKPLDCVYEMCRQDRNISGCKEVLMYLQNAERDFLSLIEAIHLEDSFDTENKPPQGVAWEVRKMMNSPTQKLVNVLPMSPMMIDQIKLVTPFVVAAEDIDPRDDQNDSKGWKLVRSRRRSSISSTISDVMDMLDSDAGPDTAVPTRAPSVYERLSGTGNSGCRRHSATFRGISKHGSPPAATGRTRTTSGSMSTMRLTAPRSAMDLPQTRSSMAKISYCRQRLWEKDIQPSLAEKIRVKKMKESSQKATPHFVTTPTKCSGMNFAAAAAGKKPSLDMHQNSPRRNLCCASERNGSLKSICETAEADDAEANGHQGMAVPDVARSLPAMSCYGLDMEGDREWREMTEEEESLAMEELSINAEIEEAQSELESVEADVELLRQVEVEADEAQKAKKSKAAMPNFPLYSTDAPYQVIMEKLTEGYKQFCDQSWSDVVEQELTVPYRDPGQLADKHEKLCSPSRKRERDDPDYPQLQAEKFRRAGEIRDTIQKEKTQRLRDLAQKREELQAKREQLAERKRRHLEERMERAHENKQMEIARIVRKAKDDEEKVMEVRFIQSCHEGNKRIDRRTRDAVLEERKQNLVEERARRAEEKAAKEHAAEERRILAEQERISRLQEKQEKRKVRSAEIAQQKTEAELELKQRKRLQKERLDELRLHGVEDKTVRKSKIKEKMVASNTRHEQTLESVRSRALQLSSPRTVRSVWTSMMDPSSWPSQASDEFHLLRCNACQTIVSCEFDALAHVVSEEHLRTAGVVMSSSVDVTEVFDQEMDAMVRIAMDDSLTSMESMPTTEDISDCDDVTAVGVDAEVIEIDNRLRASCLRTTAERPNVTQNRTLDNLVKLLSTTDFTRSIDESSAKILDRRFTDLLRTIDTDEKRVQLGDALSSMANKFYDAVMMYSHENTSSRSLMSTLRDLYLASSASSQFSTQAIINLPLSSEKSFAKKLCEAAQNDSPNCLFLLMDFCAVANGYSKRDWTVTGVDVKDIAAKLKLLESELVRLGFNVLIVHIIAGLSLDELEKAIPHLLHLTDCFLDTTEGSSKCVGITVAVIRALIARTVVLIRESADADHQPVSPRKTKEPSDTPIEAFTNRILAICHELAKNTELWKALLDSSTTSFQLQLLLASVLRHARSLAMGDKVSNHVLAAISLAGRFASVGNSQKVLCSVGWQRSLLSSIASLPLRYFVNEDLQCCVIPSLIAMTANSEAACKLLTIDVGMLTLTRFLKRASGSEDNKYLSSLSDSLSRDQWLGLIEFYENVGTKQ